MTYKYMIFQSKLHLIFFISMMQFRLIITQTQIARSSFAALFNLGNALLLASILRKIVKKTFWSFLFSRNFSPLRDELNFFGNYSLCSLILSLKMSIIGWTQYERLFTHKIVLAGVQVIDVICSNNIRHVHILYRKSFKYVRVIKKLRTRAWSNNQMMVM